MIRRNVSSGSGTPVTGMMRMFMPILMKTWLKRSVTTPTASNLAQAIARLAGDSDSGEQNHRIQREHDHAADESFLLGNDGENEVVVRHRPRQVSQGVLRALPPAFARQPARADGDQRLPHVVRIVELLSCAGVLCSALAHRRSGA